MKKSISLLLVLVMIAAILIGCGKKEETTPTTEFTIPPDITLPEDPVSLAELSQLKDWNFGVLPWADHYGADIHVVITPEAEMTGCEVYVSVTLNGMEVTSQECVWDGTSYSADLSLNAADGYEYFCTIIASTGEQESIALNTIQDATDDSLVNLASSLTAYATLVVEEWDVSGRKLSVSTAYAQVQLPRLFAGNSIALEEASLVLQLNAEEVTRQAITIPDGEGSGSYECALKDILFDLPDVTNDSQLDLVLEATLSDGTVVTAPGASWFSLDGTLMMVAG